MRAPRSAADLMLPLLLLAMVPRLARSAQDNDDGGDGDAWLEKGALDPDSGRVCDEDGTMCKLDAHAQLGWLLKNFINSVCEDHVCKHSKSRLSLVLVTLAFIAVFSLLLAALIFICCCKSTFKKEKPPRRDEKK